MGDSKLENSDPQAQADDAGGSIPGTGSTASQMGALLERSGTRAQAADPGGTIPDAGKTDSRGEALLESSSTQALLESSGTQVMFPWRDWLAALVAVRDAVGRLPALPAGFWFKGTLLALLIHVGSAVWFQRRLRRASPAPSKVGTMVAEAAKAIGLRRAPQTLMIEDACSPMVWCGGRTRLLLPSRLWSQLDPQGRKAVICHELAHIRRRDHWVRRLEVAVTCLYWWNPLAWWISRRVREEAEFCCDAWVTHLLPHGRRAYAQALLQTQGYVGRKRLAAPVVGIGMASDRVKRFARRITMVMIGNAKPKLSVFGMGLALCLALFGWLTVPARSCPKDSKESTAEQPSPPEQVVIFSDDKDPSRVAVIMAPPAPTPKPSPRAHPAPPAPPGAPVPPAPPAPPSPPHNTFEAYMAGKAPHDADAAVRTYTYALGAAPLPAPLAFATVGAGPDRRLEERLDRLEQHLGHLSERLDEITMRLDPQSGARIMAERERERAERERQRADRERERAERERREQEGNQNIRTWQWRTESPGLQFRFFGDEDDGEVIARSYRLPEGKLEALTELMVRNDVPVVVKPYPDRIEVRATRAQHAIFEAFVRLIDPSEDRGSMVTPEADHESNNLFFQQHEELSRQQKALAEDRLAELQGRFGDLLESNKVKIEQQNEAIKERLSGLMQERAAEWSKKAAELGETRTEQLRQQLRNLAERSRQRAAEHNQQADGLEAEAERLSEKLDELHEAADRLKASIRETAKGEDVKAIREQVKSIQEKAGQLERQAREIEEQADRAREKADSLDERSDALERAAEALERRLGGDALPKVFAEAAGTIKREAPGTVARALDEVAEAVTSDVPSEIVAALRKVADSVRNEGTPQVADMLAKLAESLKQQPAQLTTNIIDLISSKIESEAPGVEVQIIEDVTGAIEEQSDEKEAAAELAK